MNSRRLIGDAPRLFRVSLSRFRLGGNRLIAGVFAAPQESAPGPTRKEGVGVNHWRLTVYQRTCRGLGSPPGLGVGDERSGPLRSAPQVHVVPLPAPRPRARKEIIVPGGHNSSPRRLNHALVLAIARAKSWMRGASQRNVRGHDRDRPTVPTQRRPCPQGLRFGYLAPVSGGSVVMESKRQIDHAKNTQSTARMAADRSSAPHYGICP